MFDIREELPPEEAPPPVPKPAAAAAPSAPKPQMRYLIKKGGKQVVRASRHLCTTALSRTLTSRISQAR